MTNTISSAQLEQLRRNAKRIAREESIPLHEAQARVATGRGFKNWSLLAKGVAASVSASRVSEPPPVDTRRRYYLHGDKHESDRSRYYCALCDVFWPAEHFESKHERTKSVER